MIQRSFIVTTLISIFLLTGVYTSGCTKDKAERPDECGIADDSIISYSITIHPLVEMNCGISSGCHGSGSFNGEFNTYSALKVYVDNGTINNRVLVAKDMSPSYAPDSAKLTDCERTLIQIWLDQGAQNN